MNKQKFALMQGQAPGIAELYIYGDIDEGHWDYKNDGEWEWVLPASQKLIKDLEAMGEVKELHLYINSFGGYCHEGVAMANILRRRKCKTVAHIDAYACSVASVIACACDEVVMPRNTVMMIHDAWMPKASGNASQLRKLADDLDVQNSAFKTIYLEKAKDKLSQQKLTEMLEAETYLTAEDCFKYGLCDRIEDFSVEMAEPDDGIKKSAASNRVDIDRLCSMIKNSGKTEEIPPTEPLASGNNVPNINDGNIAPAPAQTDPAPMQTEPTINTVKNEFTETAVNLFNKIFNNNEKEN